MIKNKTCKIATRLLVVFCILLAISDLYSCKKFVQIGPPVTQIPTASVFSSDAAATSAQLAIYIKMFNESYNMAQACGLLSDELTNYSTQATLLQYYTNNMTAINGPGPWRNAYGYIYAANDIIGNLQNNANLSAVASTQLIAESKFVRAFWYFYLTNLYGDVPLVLTTDYTVNTSLGRTPQAQVYQQIISDLKDAQTYLNANYVDASDTIVTVERVRPNKGAAAALLAKVYLYTQKYDSADAQASITINNTNLYQLCTNLSVSMGTGTNYVFQRNSTETIWQLATPLPTTIFTNDAYSFILKGAPASGTTNSSTISPQLLSSFEPNDLRKTYWIGVYTTSGSSPVQYFYPGKYQVYNVPTAVSTASGVTEYTMMLRLADQYLIRAEARAHEGNLSGAAADLNAIRTRAGLSNIDNATASSQTALLTAIIHERQIELFTEWGNRWMDLIRTANINNVMGGSGGVCRAKGGNWTPTAQLFPIPQIERTNNSNLAQNQGY